MIRAGSILIKTGLWLIMVLSTTVVLNAQQLGQYTHYMSNELIINPAFAGGHDALSLTAIHRSQWVGIEGAPTTQSFSIHSLAKNDQMGLGLTLMNDRVGIHKNFTAQASYAYRLRLDRDSYISFGVQAGVNHKSSDYSALTVPPQGINDPTLELIDYTNTSLEVGAGVYLKTPKLHLGLSSPKLFSSDTELNDSVSIALNNAHYFFYGRYRTPINPNIKLQPNVLIKYLPGLPVSWDAGLNAIWNEVLMTGISYRSTESIDLLLQAKITPQMKLGYSFDYTLKEISGLGRSSHEFMLNYIFKYSNYRTRAPR